MTSRLGTPAVPLAEGQTSEGADIYVEGIVAGIIGAATVAVWFLILDTMQGRPLYTPTVLGTAFFRWGAGLAAPGNIPVSLELTLIYTWLHGLVFCMVGGIAAKLLVLAEKNPDLGFGILLLGVVFEVGFLVVAMFFGEALLERLGWQSILVGNVLAGAAMAAYFWRRHPNLVIRP
jgi:hypothetical protein